MNAKRLAGKCGVISGPGSGIGRAIALLFSREGCSLVLVEEDSEGGRETLRQVEQQGGQARLLVGDVSRHSTCREAAALALESSSTIDLVVNNAGIVRRGSVLETDPADWDRVLAVNLRSVFLMSRSALPHMKAGGVILNLASGWGLTGGRKAAAYCASKGGVVQLTRAMALDHGEQGIRVNCVCPGDTDTRLLRQEAAQLGQDWEEFLQQAAERPLGRVGTPDEIARACLFLASDESSFVTGAILAVDGGGLAGCGG